MFTKWFTIGFINQKTAYHQYTRRRNTLNDFLIYFWEKISIVIGVSVKQIKWPLPKILFLHDICLQVKFTCPLLILTIYAAQCPIYLTYAIREDPDGMPLVDYLHVQADNPWHVGPSSAFRWQTDDDPFSSVFGSSLPSRKSNWWTPLW